jgi:integrase/recombinase XerD
MEIGMTTGAMMAGYSGRLRRIMPMENWPEPDRAAWEAALAPGDGFDGAGLAARWADTTRHAIVIGYGRWIGFLHQHDPAALDLKPHARVTSVRVQAFIDVLRQRVRSGGLASYIGNLYDAARAMAPDHDWTWLRRRKRRLEHAIVRKPKHPRMVAVERIIEHALALMDRARLEAPLGNINGPVQYRDGMILAVLATRPIRRRNLAGLRLGTTLHRRDGGYLISLEGAETKNRRAYDVDLPDWLVPYMDRYLDTVRVRFPGHDRLDALWLTTKGTLIGDQGLYEQVARRTRKAFGLAINPHLFRDIAATTLAHAGGAAARAAAALLHHGSQRTSDAHYNQGRMVEAAERHQDLIEKMRAAARERVDQLIQEGAPCAR